MKSLIQQQLHKMQNEKTEKVLFLLVFIAFLSLGAIYMVHTWNTSVEETEAQAIGLAEAAEVSISKAQVATLSADSSDIDKRDYKEIKRNLTLFTKLDNQIRFAYIFVQKEDKIYFLADSEDVNSKDYSPPGQEYIEADEETYLPFKNKKTLLTEPDSDRWGNWVSVLVPMKDIETGDIIAIFGVDYPAESWYDHAILQTVQASFAVLCVSIIFIILYFALSQNKELSREKKKLMDSDAKLKESETLFRTIFNQATIGIAIGHNEKYIIATPNNIPSINPTFEKIIGRTKEELTSISWMDITHPDDLSADVENFLKFKAGEIDGYDIEKRYIRPDGSEIWIHMMVSPLQLDNNPRYNHLCLIEDISKRKEMERFLYDSQRSKSVLLDNLPGMAYRCNHDREWTMEFVSEGCFSLTGYNAESLINNKEIAFNQLIPAKYQEFLWEKWEQSLKQRSKIREEYEIISASGEVKWVWEQGQGIYDEDGNVVALEGLIMDITERKRQEIELNYMNNHDSLTGLYNRRYFEEVIACEENSEIEEKRAVLLLNLTKFTLINLTFGYNFGEKLIKELSSKLLSICTNNYSLFQLSNDRFVFYVKGYTNKKILTNLCGSVMEILNTMPALKTIGVSIGIVELDECKRDLDKILKNALIAAENVKENQIFRYSFFDTKMEEIIMREADIKNELSRVALNAEDSSIFIEYQPIVNTKTNTIVGFEALARFQSEKLGRISPFEFIPLAEETQLIIPLGKRIMRIALLFLKQIENKGYNNITMSFNVSAIQLLREDFIKDLVEVIKETKVNSSNLSIEITESFFSNNYQEINEKLEKIKRLGIAIAIDDFGTGYSSLARERELNVNCLKIDKYFIDKLMNLRVEEAITGDIISMAHKLGHYVVAEGVEHEKQRQYLLENNCDFIQGYLFSKPLSQEEAIKILDKEPIRRVKND